MKRRLLATFLSLCLLVGLIPTVALATDEEPGTEPASVCTCEALCTEGAADETCSVCAEDYTLCTYVAPDEPACAQLEGCVNGAHAADCPLYVEPTDDTLQEQEQEEPAAQPVTSTESTPNLLNGNGASGPLSGTCGAEGNETGVTWTLKQNNSGSEPATYTLTISGTGAMEDFDNPTSTEDGAVKAPWYAELSPDDDDLVPITEIVIGDGITYVGSYAFAYTSVTMAAFNENIADYGSGIYYGCTKLTTVDWTNFKPTNVNDDFVAYREQRGAFVPFSLFDQCDNLSTCKIGDETCSEGTLVLPDNITGICTAAFRGTGFSTVDFSDGLKEIEFVGPYGLASLSNLKSVTIPNDVEFYSADEGKGGARTFTGGALETVTIQSPGTTIAVEMFYNCNNLKTVNGADNIKEIEQSGFSGCGLTSFSSESVKEIGQYAFLNNTSLATLTLGVVEDIGGGAFAGCSSLKTVDIEGSTTLSIPNTAFGTSGNSTDNAAPIESFTLENGTPPTFTTKAKSSLKTLVLGDGVEWAIPTDYLSNATALETVELGNGITNIGNRAFYKCSNLKTVSLPADGQLTTIGVSAFSSDYNYQTAENKNESNSPQIKEIVIPASVTSIGDRAFLACMSLETVRVAPNSKLTNIGTSAFINCFNLKTVDLSGIDETVQIGNYSFGSSSGTRNENCIFYVSNEQVKENLTTTNVTVNTYSKNIVAITDGGIFPDGTTFASDTLSTPIKDGYKFEKWCEYSSETSNNTSAASVTSPSAGNTYIAVWDESSYTVPDELAFAEATYGENIAAQTITVSLNDSETAASGDCTAESSDTSIFTVSAYDSSNNTFTVTPVSRLGVGTYEETIVVTTPDGATHNVTVSLTINKADSTVNPGENTVHITATYGETITLTAEVAKAQTNGIALMAAQDEVEFICGSTSTSLGTALVEYSKDDHTAGVATLTYDTSKGGIPVGTSTITAVYGGSVNLNGSNTNSIQVTLNKINTSIDITPDRTSLTGGGTVTLTVDKSGLPDGAEVNVTCNNGITPSKNADDTWAATLPNSTEDYTFTASYTGDENHNASSDTCTVSVTRRSSGGGGGGGSTTYTVSTDAGRNGDVTVSPSRASYGDTVTITVEPDEGYELDELIVTDSDGDEIDVERVSATRYTFEMPRSRVTVEATFVEITEEPDLPTFTDVSEDAYYADAVLWAVANGVTYGTSATTFSPDMAVSRAQMVTFLWRAHGSPKATGANPFTDVSTSDYYYDAVLWAVANGVTNGTSATTFSPDMAVTRAQAVTFQWRAAGSPVVSGSSFGDVAADAYYVNAVTWAVANGITNGTSGTTFSPDVVVSRAQAVTFLHRELG